MNRLMTLLVYVSILNHKLDALLTYQNIVQYKFVFQNWNNAV